jgi:phosphate transport system substrate-binding protein
MPASLRPLIGIALFAQLACGSQPPSEPVVVDGSSTLAPLTTAVAADFMKTHRSMPVKVGSAGTVDGFARFCRGELDILDASRPVTSPEQAACASKGVQFIELPIAEDAITVIVNAGNAWASSMTTSELRKLWEPEAEKRVTTWKQVRADWPDRPIKLFGPGTESGTFDYFTEVISGTVDASRKDYEASADDNVIVRGVSADVEALGYVGFSYFDTNRKTLKAVAIDDEDDRVGRGPIEPSEQNVGRGVYRPLSRTLFIYINQAKLARPETKTFVESYLRKAGELGKGVGAMPLMGTAYDLARQRLAKGVTGTMYKTPEDAQLGIELLLTQ